MSYQRRLSHVLNRFRRNQVRLRLRLLNPALGNLKVAGVNLHAHEPPPRRHAGNAGRTGTHEGVKDKIAGTCPPLNHKGK